jgi:hypothetical protein
LQRISVAIEPGATSALFTHVEEDLSFPMPPGAEIDSYVVYVGFDPLGAQEMDRNKRRPPPPRQARPPRNSQS